MDDGFLLVDKPANMTSFGVVARVRRVLSQRAEKKVKVGHTGTLDPFATGLMIVVVGKECKNAEKYSKLDKVYEATIKLGQTSTTGDPEGDIREVASRQPSEIEVRQTLEQFVGEVTQTPPVFSAIKIDGQRAYDRARKGEVVVMPERHVRIFYIELLDYVYPYIKIRTQVSSGTYIRSLAVDIGTELHTGAYCTELRRTQVGQWSVMDATPLDTFMKQNT